MPTVTQLVSGRTGIPPTLLRRSCGSHELNRGSRGGSASPKPSLFPSSAWLVRVTRTSASLTLKMLQQVLGPLGWASGHTPCLPGLPAPGACLMATIVRGPQGLRPHLPCSPSHSYTPAMPSLRPALLLPRCPALFLSTSTQPFLPLLTTLHTSSCSLQTGFSF